MTNIDPSTGMPELPESYFWEVSLPGSEFVRIQLCKYTDKKTFSGKPKWEVIAWTAISVLEINEQKIIDKAYRLLANDFNPWMDKIVEPSQFVGRYPPNKLDGRTDMEKFLDADYKL